jgi:hypothetical protein
MIANNAYYCTVQKVKRVMVPTRIEWRARRFATGVEVEAVQ